MILKSLLMAGQVARVAAAQAAVPVAPATLLPEFPLSEVSCLHVRIEAKQTVCPVNDVPDPSQTGLVNPNEPPRYRMLAPKTRCQTGLPGWEVVSRLFLRPRERFLFAAAAVKFGSCGDVTASTERDTTVCDSEPDALQSQRSSPRSSVGPLNTTAARSRTEFPQLITVKPE